MGSIRVPTAEAVIEIREARESAPLEGAKCADVGGTNMFGDEFRNYEASARQDVVEESYRKQHTQMTYAFVQRKHEEWLKLDHGEYRIEEVIEMLDELVDDSDPDVDIPNSVHDFQTAERIRATWPEHDWFHLVGLLHDLGKVMALWGEPQWCVVGDTFPVGCKFSDKSVFPHQFASNPDSQDERYNTEYGVYEAHCGLDNILMAWGHDEYMYQVLKRNGCTIPEHGLAMIRFHSCYPWHDQGAYQHLTNAHDEEVIKPWVKEFNKFDLYSKGDAQPSAEDCRRMWEEYYKPLCQKYGISGALRW